MPRSQNEIHHPSGALIPPPPSYPRTTRQPLWSHRACLFAVGPPQTKEGRGVRWCWRGRSPFSKFQIRAPGEKRAIAVQGSSCSLLRGSVPACHFLGEDSTTERRLNQDCQWESPSGSSHQVCPCRSKTSSLHPLPPPFLLFSTLASFREHTSAGQQPKALQGKST